MKNLTTLFTIGFLFMLGACKEAPKGEEKTEPVAEEQTVEYKNSFPYRGIPQELVMKVWNEVDMLDYIFHQLPFSMNQTEQASIRTNVSYIGKNAKPWIPKDCVPIARQFYQTNGDIWMEADVYFTEQCQFYVFYIDGKPAYANEMSTAGSDFFKTMINQALDASKKAGH